MPKKDERPKLASPAEVAEYLNVPVTTLYQWRHRSVGPKSFRIGRHIRYAWSDVDDYVEEQQRAESAA